MAKCCRRESILVSFTIMIAMTTTDGTCPERCQCYGVLKRVSCRQAGLETIPHGIPRDTTFLDLTSNRLRTIDYSDFSMLVSLQNLYLSRNEISLIKGSIFRKQRRLTLLALDHNQLTGLNKSVLQGLTSLKTFNVNNNELTYLETNIFSKSMFYIPYFERVNLMNNNFRCERELGCTVRNGESKGAAIEVQCRDDQNKTRPLGDLCPNPVRKSDMSSTIFGVCIFAGLCFVFFCWRRNQARCRNNARCSNSPTMLR